MEKISYTLVRSDRKTLSLCVKRDGEVVVRAPRRIGTFVIESFVSKNAEWILKKQAYMAKRASAEPDAAEEECLRALAKKVLPERVAYYAGVMGLSPSGIKITSARTRFGSCNQRDSLCFSWRLMMYPPEAVDYVVVHELAHIVYKDHSARFHALVASVLPDHKARRALLRT